MRACWLKWVGRDWSISADYIWLNYSGANSARSRRPGRSCRSGASGCAASACRRRCERPLAVAVSAVRPATAQLVGLGVHRGVHDLFGESGEQLPHVDGAVAETGHGEYVRRRV